MVAKRKRKEKRAKGDNAVRIDKRNKRIAYVLLAVILLYALAYCINFVGGPSFYGDDTTYLGLAQQVVAGNFAESSYIFSIRLVQIFPIAFFYEVFGVSLLTSSAWDIIAFLGSIIIAFFIGKELQGYRAGLLAAFLLCFFPTVIILAPTISDDITMMFLTSLAMLGLLYGERRHSGKWLFLAGTMMVAAPLVSPEGAIIIPIIAVYVIVELLRKKLHLDRQLLCLFLGVAFAGILLMLANYCFSGNPFVTYTVSAGFYSAVGVRGAGGTYVTIPSTNDDLSFYPQNMFPYGLVQTIYGDIASGRLNPIQMWNQIYVINYNQSGFYFYAIVAAIIYLAYRAVAKKEWEFYFPLFWFIAGFLYLEFGPMGISLSPFNYVLSYRLQRFLTLIAVPGVVLLGMALARFSMARGRWAYVAVALTVIFIAFLVITSAQINYFWYQTLYVERYDQLAIANFLSALPNNTRIYAASSLSNIRIYMQYDNLSRFLVYDQIPDCSAIPQGAYVAIPAYQPLLGLNYTPNPLQYCPSWELVLPSKQFVNFSSDITSSALPFRVNLYYVPENGGSVAGQGQSSGSQAGFNFFNLTGVGKVNQTTGNLSDFITINNVTSLAVDLSSSQASPSDNVTVNITYMGTFNWSIDNASPYYLFSAQRNYHYIGVEAANETGGLLVTNNGPWWDYITFHGSPYQTLYGSQYANMRVSWVISPNASQVGNTIKICGGYFAQYDNLSNGTDAAFYRLAFMQQKIVNSTVINIPSSNCGYLSVT